MGRADVGRSQFARNEMTQKLGNANKELLEAIIPKNFGVGCRRPTVKMPLFSLTFERS